MGKGIKTNYMRLLRKLRIVQKYFQVCFSIVFLVKQLFIIILNVSTKYQSYKTQLMYQQNIMNFSFTPAQTPITTDQKTLYCTYLFGQIVSLLQVILFLAFARLPIYCVYTYFLSNISTTISFITLLFRTDRLYPPMKIPAPND